MNIDQAPNKTLNDCNLVTAAQGTGLKAFSVPNCGFTAIQTEAAQGLLERVPKQTSLLLLECHTNVTTISHI